jgi:hypothetical protein
MKNTFKVLDNLNRARSAKVPLLISAIVAIIGFSIVACGGGDTYEPLVYRSAKDGTNYVLTITKNTTKAALTFTPGNGDFYKLVITSAGVTKTSTGTITVSGNALTLKHTASSAEFTVTISTGNMASITGTIPVDGGGQITAPGAITPQGNNPGGQEPVPPAGNNLTGTTWKAEDEVVSITIKFTTNSAFTMEFNTPAGKESASGTYNVNGNNIALTLNGNTFEGLINGNTLVLYNAVWSEDSEGNKGTAQDLTLYKQ